MPAGATPAAARAEKRGQLLRGFALILVLIASVVALLYPHLRTPLGLISAGIALFFIRWRFFRLEGVSGVPFGKSRALFGRSRRDHTKQH
jgi:hypothetical protein